MGRLSYREILLLGLFVGLLAGGSALLLPVLLGTPSDVDFMLERADTAIIECEDDVSAEALAMASDARAQAVRLRSSDPGASQQSSLRAIQVLRDDGCLQAKLILELLP